MAEIVCFGSKYDVLSFSDQGKKHTWVLFQQLNLRDWKPKLQAMLTLCCNTKCFKNNAQPGDYVKWACNEVCFGGKCDASLFVSPI